MSKIYSPKNEHSSLSLFVGSGFVRLYAFILRVTIAILRAIWHFILGKSDGSLQPVATTRWLIAQLSNTLVSGIRPGGVAVGMLMAGWLGATLQAQAQSPGGVSSGLQLWLKADAGTSTTTDGAALTGWNDQSGNSRNHTQTTTAYQPKYKANGFNFNPAVTFDGLDAMVGNALASGKEAVHVFAMARVGDSGWRTIYGFGRDATHVQWLSTLPSVWLYGNYYANNNYGTNYGVTSHILPKDGSQKTIHWNGTSSNIAGTNTYVFNASKMGVGSDVTSDGLGLSENFLGDIAEVVIYKTGTPSTDGGRMDATDIQKVESYLGLKYGVTLSHNYLSAAGTTIYNVSSYSANVTGIGREDASGLNQKQSKSIDANALVTIGIETGIASTNAANVNTFSDDNSFEIIGSNGLSSSYSIAYLPSTYTSPVPSAFKLMPRIWTVQETGTVGTITVSVPATTKAELLLVSSSATFTPGSATEITLTPDGNGNLTAQVDLNDGQFFTFGATVIAPGGVSADLQIWVKADKDVVASGNLVSQWTDQSTENHNLVQTNTNWQPQLQAASTNFNFNPSLKFDGVNDRLAYKLTRFMSTTSSGTFYGAAGNAVNGGYENLGDLGIDNPHMGTLGNQQIMWMNSSAPVRIDHPTPLTKDKTTLLGYYWNGGSPNVGSGLRQNGTDFYDATTEATAVGNGGPVDGQFQLGSYEGVENWNGPIAESFLYSRNLSVDEKNKVETYLALKYGVTLTHSYTASNGTMIYDVSSYSANIAGIGRDDASGLNQKQSRSVNTPGGIVTIGLGTGLVTANTLNTNSFSADKTFEIIGDNGLPASYSALYAPTSFTPAGGAGFYRMARTWKVQETGTVGIITVGALASTFADYLLVSNSPSFPSGSTQEIILTSDGNGNLVAQVDLADGQYFTFGSAEKAPGGVLADLKLWLKADAISGVSNGSAVQTWDNSLLSNPSYTVTQSTVAYRPTYYNSSTDKLVNFNPTLYFDGGINFLGNTTPLMPSSSPYTFISVGIDEDAGTGYRALFSSESILDYFVLYKQGGPTADNGWTPYAVGGSPDRGDFGRGTKYSPKNGSNGFWNGSNFTSDATTQVIRPQVVGMMSQNSAVADPFYTWTDGFKTDPGWSPLDDGLVFRNPFFQSYAVGADMNSAGTGAEFWLGRIPEQIAYGRQLTDTEMQKVNTYLAIKYGITLGQGNGIVGRNGNNYDYVATDGTVIWSATANSGYSYDIAGIGQDNLEGLNQKQSRSEHGSFQPAIGLGTVAATNDANANVFSVDKSYMIWGSNGLSDSYSISYTPHSFTVSAPVYLMNRIWKVQETGTVGTVMVSIPGSTTGVYLLVGNTPTSLSAGTATEYALTSDGNGNLVATVDLANGQYFTFGKALYAPGCVTANLLTWYKADLGVTTSGSAVSNWTDLQSGYDVYQTTAANQPTLQPASVSFNYNPYLNFDGANDYLTYKLSRFISTTASGTMFGAASNRVDNGGYENLADLGIDNPHMGIYNSTQIQWLNGSAPVQVNGTLALSANQPQVYGYYFNSASTNGGAGTNRGLRLDGVDTYSATTASSAIGNGGPVDGMWTIGSYEGVENWNGGIGEIILYDRSLTTQEKDRIDTYLAVKYGATLRHNYLAGDGTTIYNVSTYGTNVFGTGRDDCQQLYQKQSKSVNGTAKMTISISNTIAASNLTNPGSLTADKTFLVVGDNGATGTSALSSAAATSCPPPPSADRYTNLSYKFTETGSAGPVLVQEDMTGFGFNLNYPVYMQVFSDAGFTTLLASVPMSYTNGLATAIYDFPATATSYVRFAGNTTAPANLCVAPKAQTFHWNGWNYGTKQKVLLPNYIPSSQSATAAMTMSVTVTDNNNMLLYRPTVDWWPVFDGIGLFIPRNDNASTENNIITTRMQFRQGTSTSVVAANTVSFKVWDIDGYIGGRDIVKIYGKQGSNIISPQLSRFTQWLPFDALQLNYQGSQQQAIGSNIPWDLGRWADVYVNFDNPVEEVYVEYRKDNTYAFNVYNDMRIGPVTVTCAPPKPKEPLLDNVYIYKEVSPNPQKTDEEVTYKFTVQNTNCDNKTINLTDNLPGGLIWKDSTFVTSTSLTVNSVNGYGNINSLQLSNVTVPPGTHYFYATATGSVAGTYLNQASYVVTNGTGATYLSDDPSESGTTAQPTPLTLVDNDPEANLTVQKTVDKATAGQNEVLTYTYTITNPNASSAVLSSFQDVLPGELTYVGGTLTGIGSATASPYSGSAVLAIRNLDVPAASSLTFTVQANTNSYTIGAVANNVAQVSPDVNSGFRIKTYNSNAASTTIIVPPTVAILSPVNNTTTVLNPTVSGTATPGSTVVLTGPGPATLCTTTATAGGTWSCQVNLSPGEQSLSAVASNIAGTSTPAITQITAVNEVTPFTTQNPPVKTASAGGTQAGNAATELAPAGGTTPFTYSNDTGNPSCTGVMGATELPASSSLTVDSNTGSYSYVAPTTPGLYYFCIKVCDSSSPTPQCETKTYTVVVSPVPASGNINCASTQIIGAINQGTAGSAVLKITMTVSTTGSFPVSITGSGFSLQMLPANLVANTGGMQTFYVPVNYSGATLGMLDVTITGAGTCSYNLAGQTPTGKNQPVMDIGGSCIAITPASLGK